MPTPPAAPAPPPHAPAPGRPPGRPGASLAPAARLLAAALAAAPHAAAAQAGGAARPRVLTIEAMDYAFRAPAAAPAGVTTLRLVNRGRHMHHVQLVRLEGGRTVRDLLRDWKPGRANPAYMAGDGGPTAALGGQTLEGTVLLRPGRYALLCWVPAADGQLHLQKGMFGQLEVTPGAPAPAGAAARPAAAVAGGGAAGGAAAAALPEADVTITMLDYGYVVPEIRRGPRVVRVLNGGPQAHELVMVRLAPGRTARDAAAWAERGQTGDAPGAMVGGVAALSPGHVAQFAVDFAPGRYALICFVPDQKDGAGRPHTEHGMLREVVVR